MIDFFVVGAAKSGTTAIHDYLQNNSSAVLPRTKETNYFAFKDMTVDFQGPLDAQTINKFSVVCAADYEKQFSGDGIKGEVCPLYLYSPLAPRNIYAHNPNAKIIVVLRNPIDRAYSNFMHLVRDGREELDFRKSFDSSASRIASNWEWFWDLDGQGMYMEQLRRYFELFPKDHIMTIEYSELVSQQEKTVGDICAFIGVKHNKVSSLTSNVSGVPKGRFARVHKVIFSPGFLNNTLRRCLPVSWRRFLGGTLKNILTSKQPMKFEDRAYLTEHYRQEMAAVSDSLGGDFKRWLN